MNREQILAVLRDMGVKRVAERRNGEITACCPVHHDENPSWSVNALKAGNPCNCFACDGGRGPFAVVVARAKAMPVKAAVKYLSRFGDVDFLESDYARSAPPEQPLEAMLSYYRACGPNAYLRERKGIPDEVQELCEIGSDRQDAVIPWRWDGRLLALQRSCPNGKKFFIGEFDRSQTLYAPLGLKDKVLLVEGASDVLRAIALGVDWAAATGSADLSAPQARLLLRSGAQRVILAFDNDYAGSLAVRRAKKRLQGLLPVALMPYLRWIKDVNDFPSRSLLEEALSLAR